MAELIFTDVPDDVKARFWARIDVRGPQDCWEWRGGLSYKRNSSYGIVWFEKKAIGAHRLAMMIETGRRFGPREFVCHHCDNPKCCNPAHLFLGSNADNVADMVSKGRNKLPPWLTSNRPFNRARGERMAASRLTASSVREIRQRRAMGETQPSLAKEFGVSQSVISGICLRKSWKHVT